MRALIVGAGMRNKGAELMLRALVAEMRRRHPTVELGLSPGIPGYARAKSLDLQCLALPLPNVGYRRFLPYFLVRNLIGRRVRSGVWAWKDVELVLDISGFTYSDQWGLTAAKNLRRLAEDVRGRGGHVILFPQAFGPFDLPGHAEAMRKALAPTSLVFARDHQSLHHIRSLPFNGDLRLAPDITLRFGAVERPEEPWVAIVPNIRMIDQGKAAWGGTYIELLRTVIDRIHSAGLGVKVVIHDTSGGDDTLASRIAEADRPWITTLRDADPLRLKHTLSRATFVVGSRFHALASSLACGVPVLALGWSHKYQELLAEYGLNGFSFREPAGGILDRLDELLVGTSRQELRSRIAEANRSINDHGEVMWRAIERFIPPAPT